MASLSPEVTKDILGTKRKASMLNYNPPTHTEPAPKGEDDYMAVAACMRMLEFVLYSNGGMEEHKFTIWSTFKTLHAYHLAFYFILFYFILFYFIVFPIFFFFFLSFLPSLITNRYGKINFLRMFSNPSLKLDLLNFFLDNCNTPKDRNKEYNTKVVSHNKIIQYFFNTNPTTSTRRDDPAPNIEVSLRRAGVG